MSINPPCIATQHNNNYRALSGESAWRRLHPAIHKRFEIKKMYGEITYTGQSYC